MRPHTLNIAFAAALLTLSCSGLMTARDRSVSDLESELAVVKKRISAVEKKNTLLETENGDLRDTVRQIKNDCAVLKNQSDARIRDLAGMNERLKSDYLETKARLTATIAGLEKKIAEKDEDLAGKEAALKDLREAAEQLKSALRGKDSELAQAEKKNRDLSSELEKLKAACEKNDLLLKEREEALRALRGEMDSLGATLREKTAEIKGLRSRLDSLEQKKTD